MKQSDGQTLFAWQLGFEDMKNDICGPLAPHPSKFREAGNLQPGPDTDAQSPYSMTKKGLRIKLSIEHKGNDAYGMAILHCGTYSTSSSQLGLPVIRLGPPGVNTYARDARYIGPLVSVTAKKGTSKVVFMKQEPGQRVKERLGLLANISHNTLMSFPMVCCSAEVTRAIPPGYTSYRFPPSCRRGAILMTGHDQSHLLILFNIEMQCVRQYICKVIYADAKHKSAPWEKQLYRLARKIHESVFHKKAILAQEISREPSWSLTHGNYGPSNSRSSFAHLPNDRVVFASIVLQSGLDSKDFSNLVLEVNILDHSERPQEPYESGVPGRSQIEAVEVFSPNSEWMSPMWVGESDEHRLAPLPQSLWTQKTSSCFGERTETGNWIIEEQKIHWRERVNFLGRNLACIMMALW